MRINVQREYVQGSGGQLGDHGDRKRGGEVGVVVAEPVLCFQTFLDRVLSIQRTQKDGNGTG